MILNGDTIKMLDILKLKWMYFIYKYYFYLFDYFYLILVSATIDHLDISKW